jgi:hypothetical protein
MDSLELLGRLGEVDPADQAVLDAAMDRFAEAVASSGHTARFATRTSGWRHRGLLGAAAAVALVVVLGQVILGNSGMTARSAGSHPAQRDLPRQVTAGSGRSGHVPHPGSSVIAAVLTAFSARGGYILQVSKTVTGEGTCCRYRMWIWPLAPTRGQTVRSRIQSFTVSGSRLADQQLTYAAPAPS